MATANARKAAAGLEHSVARAAQLHRQGRLDAAAAGYREAIALAPGMAELHFNLGTALHGLGQVDEAIECYRVALVLRPDLVVAHDNLGNALARQGQLAEAVTSYRAALSLAPDHIGARYNLGVALHQHGRLDEAIECYRGVVARRPDAGPALYNLAHALRDSGRLDEAIAAYRTALAREPGALALRVNLAEALHARGALDEAVACYESALLQAPDDARLHGNLGNVQDERGERALALASYRRALALVDAPHVRANLARCLRHVRVHAADADLRALLTRAVAEAWIRPADLAPVALEAIDASAPDEDLAADPLLHAVLVSTPVCRAALEQRLTRLRRAGLDAAMAAPARGQPVTPFASALARQCFINEFVFACDDREERQVAVLRERIRAAQESGGDVAEAWVVAVASYGRLDASPAAARLLARSWPSHIEAVLIQQIAEPRNERALGERIPQLTPIADATSAKVREQYEQNPYPRWTIPADVTPHASFNAFLRRQFPRAGFEPLARDDPFDMLIAGCGTGQEAVEAARHFPAARVLAVDLSRASLGYAARKSWEARLSNIEYAQADLLAIEALGRSFEVVSAVGVLHHLADPAAGLQALLRVLKPGGFLRLGLYSERARQDVVAAREFIAQHAYAADASGVRRCRQDVMAQPQTFERVLARRDFYATSECRDLLFHVQEHRFTLDALATLLDALGLRFLGFLLEPGVLRRYRERFAHDRADTDLASWSCFEAEFPGTFAGMYRFWLQKPRA